MSMRQPLRQVIIEPVRLGVRNPRTRSRSGGGGSGATGILRAAAAYNHISTITAAVTTRSRIAGRSRKIIGSGDRRNLVVASSNFALVASGVDLPGNTATIIAAYLLDVTTGISAQLTWDGSTSREMQNGETFVLSDPVLPSAFGKSSFAVGDVMEIRYEISISANGKFCLQGAVPAPGEEARNYDPAATTITNLDGTGALTWTGTNPTNPRGIGLVLLGEFVSGDPETFGGIGDSIMEYAFDNSTGATGGTLAGLYTGFFDRAMYDDVATLSNPRAGINLAKYGSLYTMWTNAAAYLNPYLACCSTFIEEYGTNHFTATSNSGSASTAIAAARSLWSQIRTIAAIEGGRDVTIVRTKLLCRTTGAWSASDGSDQTVYGQWGAGGDVELFNAAMLADVGVAGRVDQFVDFGDAARLAASGADFYKWAAVGTTDGIHPVSTVHEAMAVKLRAALAA